MNNQESNEPSETSLPTTPEEFTKHVGADSFEEAVAVLLRSHTQAHDKIEEMFKRIKEQGRQLSETKAQLEAARTQCELRSEGHDDLRTRLNQANARLANAVVALGFLEEIRTEKLAAAGLCAEANAVSKARVELDKLPTP
jgi:hypothetical protein